MLFDKIYVVSLQDSHERRSYVSQHLRDHGLDQFKFHNATGANDARVRDARLNGLVATYPNCFRCGKLSCGRDDCNNVLIDPQVATFLTYMDLWKKIANEPQVALIL